jgi:hypothetical protein
MWPVIPPQPVVEVDEAARADPFSDNTAWISVLPLIPNQGQSLDYQDIGWGLPRPLLRGDSPTTRHDLV